MDKPMIFYSRTVLGVGSTSIVDYFSETYENKKIYAYQIVGGGELAYSTVKICQSFTSSLTSEIRYAKFYMDKSGNINDGFMYAYMYTHSGTYGISSLPTNVNYPLAVSSGVSTTVLSDNNPSLVTFEFVPGTEAYYENRIMQKDTPYVIGVYTTKASGTGEDDGTIFVHYDSGGTPVSHAGNMSLATLKGYFDDYTWYTYPNYDLAFYVYGDSSLMDKPMIFYSGSGIDKPMIFHSAI